MKLNKKITFTDEEKARIAAAVRDIEKKTSGEVVVYFVDESDSYPQAKWKGALLFSMTVLVFISFSSLMWGLSSIILPAEISVIALLTAIGGFLLIRSLSPIKKMFVSENHLREKVYEKAVQVFVKEEIFKTKYRTGILILISYFEKMVQVIGDSGINEKVKPEEWSEVVDEILKGIKNKTVTDGIVKAIQKCGVLLERAHLPIQPDDKNELGDALRTND